MKHGLLYTLGPIVLVMVAFATSPAQMQPAQQSPVQLQPGTAIPLSPWKQVAKLGPETLQVGTFYSGSINQPYYLQDDFVSGFSAVFMHLMAQGRMPGRDLLFHVWESQEKLFGRLYLYLRGDRSGSRTFQIKITYLPEDIDSFTTDTGGTLTVKTNLAADGNSLNNPYGYRVVATQTYAAKQGISGRDETVLTFTHAIGPNLFSTQPSPYACFDLFGKPSSQVMSGKIVSIELYKR